MPAPDVSACQPTLQERLNFPRKPVSEMPRPAYNMLARGAELGGGIKGRATKHAFNGRHRNRMGIECMGHMGGGGGGVLCSLQ